MTRVTPESLSAAGCYQAIETRFLGPTNHRGARVKASAEAGSVTVPWDHALGASKNHAAAAIALMKKFGWDDRAWAMGGNAKGTGFTFVCTGR